MEGDLQHIVGANIRRVRQEMGYSQESFGEQVGWHRTFVGAVERGERNLTLKTIERVAEKLGVHPLALVFDGVATFATVAEPGQRPRAVTFAPGPLAPERLGGATVVSRR